MSMVIWEQTPSRIVIFTDTLVAEDSPTGYASKIRLYPTLNLAVCATGDIEMIAMWGAWIETHLGIGTVEALAAAAPIVLRELWDMRAQEIERWYGPVPDQNRTNFYHLAIDRDGRAVTYQFPHENDFEPPEADYRTVMYAAPDPPGGIKPIASTDDAIKAAYRIKRWQDDLGARGEPRVFVGGELYRTVLTDGQINQVRVHVFDDIEDTDAQVAAYWAERAVESAS